MDVGELGVYMCMFVALYFEVFLLISFLERRPPAKSPTRPKHYPSVDIIVPCWNEEKTLAGTVESLLALDYPADKLHIVIVNDGSTDNTQVVAEQFRHHPQIQVFSKKNEGSKFAALNFGIMQSNSEFVGCLDADSFVAPDALLEMIKKFEEVPDAMASTPVMKVFRPRTLLECMQSVEYSFGIFYKKMFDNMSAISVIPGPFSIYRREVFGKIGLFRKAHHTEDMEMTFRMHLHGLKIVNAHTAHVYTTVPNTVRKLVKQRTRWSQGYLQNSQDYSYMYFNRRFGNFGMLVLPFGLVAFIGGLYTAGYAAYQMAHGLIIRAYSLWATHIPLHTPSLHPDWFYLNTGMLSVLVIIMLCFSFAAILLGQHISQTRLTIKSYVAFFLLFGFIAPIWLMRAAWGTLRARESVWR